MAGIVVEGPGTLLKVNCGGEAWGEYQADQDVAVDPAFVARVADVVAEARGADVAALAETTCANARRIFQLEG